MATVAQVNQYNDHKLICQDLGIGQSTLKHGALKGAVSAPSATGVTTYTGPNPRTLAPVTTDTLVWATWQPQPVRTDHEPQVGRMGLQRLIGQCPAIDDNQNAVTISHDDSLVDGNGTTYRILSPAVQPDLAFWTFELLKRK